MRDLPVWLQRVFLSLPLVGFLGAIGLAEAARAGAPRYELCIEGFDPRDLVRGHYLLYRFVTSPLHGGATAPSPKPASADHLACVSVGSDGTASLVTFSPDEAQPTTCKVLLPRSFVDAPHRFYVQEDKGSELEGFVREGRASVEVVIPRGASPSATALLIDGKPAKDAKPKD